MTFVHRQSAHCESGVVSSLLTHHGMAISEPLAFGIGSGLFFVDLPMVKVNGISLVSFRMMPRFIIRRTRKLLGIDLPFRTYKDPGKAMEELDQLLDQGIPVGLQVGVFWLPFFPDAMRFHFNGHNIVVYGRSGDDYLVSDPCFDDPVRCPRRDLMKARFARGAMAPRGTMYYVRQMPEGADFGLAIRKGLGLTSFLMLRSPPLGGVYGMRTLSRSLVKWPAKLGEEKARLSLAQLIRMSEEIGTGGAGFRYIYAAFLQEAAGLVQELDLAPRADEMTGIGDDWRNLALVASRICKNRPQEGDSFEAVSQMLLDLSRREQSVFRQIRHSLKG